MATSIVKDSTMTEVYDANIAEPTVTDIDVWTKIDPLAAADTITTKVGVFGSDLTDLYADCAIATACNPEDYKSYTGWAIGVQWTWATLPADAAFTGVCFADDKNCVRIETDTDAANII